jgi:hypothetical protein
MGQMGHIGPMGQMGVGDPTRWKRGFRNRRHIVESRFTKSRPGWPCGCRSARGFHLDSPACGPRPDRLDDSVYGCWLTASRRRGLRRGPPRSRVAGVPVSYRAPRRMPGFFVPNRWSVRGARWTAPLLFVEQIGLLLVVVADGRRVGMQQHAALPPAPPPLVLWPSEWRSRRMGRSRPGW